ncbi:TonB-dependent Receptor Plug Domain [Pseudarcicella hirudinis]|uniref:TonB-dependent Receptor Plug Domain n=1 Tax=Pseudarcicella hirudinis TaxID=1079859 RepID=A0A1I5YLI5_9BACT|nr:TonB-dependent receptor [Pseudarcicella hirudinis]SFQ44747.1 TonB-dependent Receptor Plug Domain [Pseudarcicella hirudinis]
MKTFIIILVSYLLIMAPRLFAQTTIKGKVTDAKGHGLPGANVFLKGAYDGATADAEGNFKFQTSEKDTATLACTFVGFEAFSKKITLSQQTIEVSIKLREAVNELNMVTITAGAFEASDERKTTPIKPLDVVTTAGAAADVTQAMQLLTPGSQRNGESTGMFVRGGSAQESKILIDGLTVQNAYNTPSPDVASRSRFSPFQFKGMAFSTGGYSAQYGQALSAVLLMNTMDLATESGHSVNVNLAGVSYGYTHLTDKLSFSNNVNYTNVTPLFKVYPQNITWTHIPEQFNYSSSFHLKPTSASLFKVDAVYATSQTGMLFKNVGDELNLTEYGIRNKNLLVTSTYQNILDKEANWTMKTGLSYSYNLDKINIGNLYLEKTEQRSQGRAVFTRALGTNSNLLFGTEFSSAQYDLVVDQTQINNGSKNKYGLTDNFSTVFSESEFYVTPQLAARVGLRGEYSSLSSGFNVAPRFSLAYKTGTYSQVSLATGNFYQTPDYQYFYYGNKPTFEKSTHYVLNYQYIRNQRTFRIEGYYKNYASLVREMPATEGYFDANPNRFPVGKTDNTGFGYAQGIDVFFRDNKTFKNGQVWINYSYLDSKRLYANYLTEAMPTFASNHNLNVIYKQYISKPMMTASVTYSYTSGRPYFNPNNTVFLADRTPDLHNVSVGVNYLTHVKGNFLVIYFQADNVFGFDRVYNYRYTEDGKSRYTVGPTANRMFIIGAFISISKKKQLPEDMRKE